MVLGIKEVWRSLCFDRQQVHQLERYKKINKDFYGQIQEIHRIPLRCILRCILRKFTNKHQKHVFVVYCFNEYSFFLKLGNIINYQYTFYSCLCIWAYFVNTAVSCSSDPLCKNLYTWTPKRSACHHFLMFIGCYPVIVVLDLYWADWFSINRCSAFCCFQFKIRLQHSFLLPL